MNSANIVSQAHVTDYRSTVRNHNQMPSNLTGKSERPSTEDVKANLNKDQHGALGSITDSMRELASDILSPKSCLVGKKTIETSASRSRESLTSEYAGPASSIRNAIREYAKTARESVGPPVEITDAIKTFEVNVSIQSLAELLEENQHIDTSA